MFTKLGRTARTVYSFKRRLCSPQEHICGGWIQYQLSLINVTFTDLAEKIGVRDNSVWAVIHGRMTSARIRQTVADTLGLPDWDAVISAARRATKENVV